MGTHGCLRGFQLCLLCFSLDCNNVCKHLVALEQQRLPPVLLGSWRVTMLFVEETGTATHLHHTGLVFHDMLLFWNCGPQGA